MKLTNAEVEFLSAWAREQREIKCYGYPAHRLQMAHGIASALFIPFIKAWARQEGKKDEDIFQAAANQEPAWPWSSAEQFQHRLEEAKEGSAVAGTPH